MPMQVVVPLSFWIWMVIILMHLSRLNLKTMVSMHGHYLHVLNIVNLFQSSYLHIPRHRTSEPSLMSTLRFEANFFTASCKS